MGLAYSTTCSLPGTKRCLTASHGAGPISLSASKTDAMCTRSASRNARASTAVSEPSRRSVKECVSVCTCADPYWARHCSNRQLNFPIWASVGAGRDVLHAGRRREVLMLLRPVVTDLSPRASESFAQRGECDVRVLGSGEDAKSCMYDIHISLFSCGYVWTWNL